MLTEAAEMADISWVMDRFVPCLGSRQPARNHLENQRKCFAVTFF